MQDQENNTLIIHDTFIFQDDLAIKDWLSQFKDNLALAWRRLEGTERNYILSSQLARYPEEYPVLNEMAFDSAIFVTHCDLEESKNLNHQINHILKDIHVQGKDVRKKLLFVPLGNYRLELGPLEDLEYFVYPMCSESGQGLFHSLSLLQPGDHEYWNKILEINDHFITEDKSVSERFKKEQKYHSIIIGTSTPEMQDKRKRLIIDLEKRGIKVFREPAEGQRSMADDSIIPRLEKAQLIIQLIGSSYHEAPTDQNISIVEEEYDFFSKIVSGELKRTVGIARQPTRLIWIPKQDIILDDRQIKLIKKIKRQIKYLEGRNEIFTGPYEELKDYIFYLLNTKDISRNQPDQDQRKLIYLIHQKADLQRVLEYSERIKPLSADLEMTHNITKSENFFQTHQELIRNADAIIIYLTNENMLWYDNTIQEVIKSIAAERSKPYRFLAVTTNSQIIRSIQKYKEFSYINLDEIKQSEDFLNQLSKMYN